MKYPVQYVFFFQAEDGIRDLTVTGVQTCALPILTARKHLFELRTQRGKLKEHCVEGAIARLDSLVSVQHDERIGNRVEDRLGAFAFVDDLIDACAESSHISERQHGAGDLTIACCVGGYPHNEPLLPIAKVGA